jgi:hypothetical protein
VEEGAGRPVRPRRYSYIIAGGNTRGLYTIHTNNKDSQEDRAKER